jgi:hypothetical protein
VKVHRTFGFFVETASFMSLENVQVSVPQIGAPLACVSKRALAGLDEAQCGGAPFLYTDLQGVPAGAKEPKKFRAFFWKG